MNKGRLPQWDSHHITPIRDGSHLGMDSLGWGGSWEPPLIPVDPPVHAATLVGSTAATTNKRSRNSFEQTKEQTHTSE